LPFEQSRPRDSLIIESNYNAAAAASVAVVEASEKTLDVYYFTPRTDTIRVIASG